MEMFTIYLKVSNIPWFVLVEFPLIINEYFTQSKPQKYKKDTFNKYIIHNIHLNKHFHFLHLKLLRDTFSSKTYLVMRIVYTWSNK